MNLGQAMNTWGAMYRMTGDKSYIEAGKAGWEKVMRYHGQASGVFTGDETLSGTPPARGTETCTVGASMLTLHDFFQSPWAPMKSLSTAHEIAFDSCLLCRS